LILACYFKEGSLFGHARCQDLISTMLLTTNENFTELHSESMVRYTDRLSFLMNAEENKFRHEQACLCWQFLCCSSG
jgi:hypothetical protein